MALKLKYTDEHGIVRINMSPNSTPSALKQPIFDKTDQQINKEPPFQIKSTLDIKERFELTHSKFEKKDSKFETKDSKFETKDSRFDIKGPKFDTINHRFGSYDLFGGKYEAGYKTDSSGEVPHSLFRSRYNSIEEELANTPYAFATERSLRSANQLDITIDRSIELSPSKDIEDDRFFNRRLSLEYEDAFRENTPAFTVTQLIHAQDRYFDLSKKESNSNSIFETDNNKSFVVQSTPDFERTNVVENEVFCKEVSSRTDSSGAAKQAALPRAALEERTSSEVSEESAFKVLKLNSDVDTQTDPIATTVVPISVRKKEKSFAILTETPVSRPSSPRSLPPDIRQGRVSPFKGRGFREETSRHNTPRTSAATSLIGSRANSPPPRRRTNSLSKIDNMASTATLPPPILTHPPRNFLKENIEGIRQISDLNKEKNQAEAEKKKIEEETAILKEMGLSDKQAKREARSIVASRSNSRVNSRSNSPGKINLRSRSSSPSTNLSKDASKSKENKVFINANDGMPKPATHKSRVRSVSKSQPQSKGGSPKNSKIPKRQSSVSPKGTLSRRGNFISKRQPSTNLLSQDARFISSSTSSIHETIRVGSTIHDKRFSQSAQHLSLSPDHIKGKPPISPGRGGPPPANKSINAKRLSPIVGTPNKSPIDDKVGAKPGLKPGVKKPVKTTATSRVNSKPISREPSLDKSKTAAKPATKPIPKPISRTPSTKSIQKPATPPKTEPKKPINRTDSMKSLTRTSSTKNLASKPPLKRSDSKISNKSQSSGKINEIGKKDPKKKETKSMSDSATDPEEIPKQDNETQYDNLKITNDKGELVIMTKKSIVSMTTAAITSQPLEIVTTVTNQLPNTFEKVREKRNIERLSSRESLIGKEETKSDDKKKGGKSKKESKEDKNNDKSNSEESHKLRPLQPPFDDPQLEKVKQKIYDILKTPEISRENILSTSPKAKPEPKFKNVAEKTKVDVKQTKDSITDKLMDMKNQMAEQQKEATEAATSKIRNEAAKIVDSIITPVEEPKDVPDKVNKVDEVKKNIEPIVMVVNEKKKEAPEKKPEVPEKKQTIDEKKPDVPEKKKEDVTEKKKDTVGKKKEVVEKQKDLLEAVEKVNETLVKGEAEVEVLSSNVSTPGMDKISMRNKKMADGNGSDTSHSNGGFPQSTSTTPKPPARTKKEQKEKEKEQSPPLSESEPKDDTQNGDHKKTNICSRLMGKCKTKCCPCCIKGEEEKETEELTERREREGTEESGEKKQGVMSKFSWCKKKTPVEEEAKRHMERAAGKGATIEYEDETKRKRKLRDIICCCGSKRRVTDASIPAQNVADVTMSPGVVGDTGCCGKKRQVERRDSILSDRPPNTCCNNALTRWARGMCRRQPAATASRRASMFSKNKSLSPTLPPEIRSEMSNLLQVTPVPSPRPSLTSRSSKVLVSTDFMKRDIDVEDDVEDTRKKLEPSLIEHTSMIRAAIPILPIVLAYYCLVCNVVVPGLGSIFSGLFCLCFGIPRFGPHDGAKYRIGSFIINLLVGAGQLFTVLFCLVGWGWSIWWGVIMIKISRKYKRLKREAELAEAEAAAPVTTNNHTRA